uniref:ABC transporter ATP-binding protein n=1 Tax=Fulvivirga sp. TaxID=1931237 RepID=UPI00404B8691
MAKRRFKEDDNHEKKKVNKENLKKLVGIYKYVLPYKTPFIFGLFLLLLTSATVMSFPLLSGKLLDIASGKSDWYIKDIDTIVIVMVVILFIQGIVSFLRVYLFAVVSEKSMANIRYGLYKKYMMLPFTFYDKRRVGELISRITSDVSMLQDTLSVTIAELLRQFSILIIGTFIIFYTTTSLSLFMLGTFPVIIVIAIIFGRYIRKLSKNTQDDLAKTNVIVEETLQSIQTVKSFTNELFETLRYRKSLDNVIGTALRAAKYRAAFISFIIFVLFGGIVAIMWYGALLVKSGEMTVGDLLSFVLYTTFIGGSIAGLGDLYGQVQKAIGASDRIIEVLDEPDEEDVVDAKGKLVLQGNINFSQVGFSYPTRLDFEVLNDIQLSIKSGEKVALVGPSGAGKSTLVQLLMRYYPVGQGEITIDGKNIAEYPLKAYRENIGVVPQEVILFGGSIRENIAYGKQESTEEEIMMAAKKANAFDFISSFPEGFDTLVGERGVKLSGGQRQRIAIARAILKDPAILVLDEATSSLDAESEHLVQEALTELMKGRTSIIIAHRLSTVRQADKIFVLKDGKIAESGSHDELIAIEDGVYGNLVRLQFNDGQEAAILKG